MFLDKFNIPKSRSVHSSVKTDDLLSVTCSIPSTAEPFRKYQWKSLKGDVAIMYYPAKIKCFFCQVAKNVQYARFIAVSAPEMCSMDLQYPLTLDP